MESLPYTSLLSVDCSDNWDESGMQLTLHLFTLRTGVEFKGLAVYRLTSWESL